MKPTRHYTTSTNPHYPARRKHGEIWPGPGLTREGKEDDRSLLIRGWERAGAWAALFGTLIGADVYPFYPQSTRLILKLFLLMKRANVHSKP